MLDFKQELYNLLKQETHPLPGDELAETALIGQQILTSLNKKQSEISLQVEEIYDLVGNMDNTALQNAVQSEQLRADRLAEAVVGLCDMLEDICAYARGSGDADLDKQMRLIWRNAGNLLEKCGFVRLGEVGQPLDPEIHTVRSVTASPFPREHVAQVLQSGYRYQGRVARKATVIVSKGEANEQDHRY
jgi:molecular chaperone GrpE (heat shock protein)